MSLVLLLLSLMCWDLGSAEGAWLLLPLVSEMLALLLGVTDGAAAAGCSSFLRLLEVSRVVLLPAAGRLSSAAAAGDAAGVLALLAAGAAVLEGLRGAMKELRVVVLLPLLLLASLPLFVGRCGAAGRGSLKGLLLGHAACAGSWDKGEEVSAAEPPI